MVDALGLGRGDSWLVDAFHDSYLVPHMAGEGMFAVITPPAHFHMWLTFLSTSGLACSLL